MVIKAVLGRDREGRWLPASAGITSQEYDALPAEQRRLYTRAVRGDVDKAGAYKLREPTVKKRTATSPYADKTRTKNRKGGNETMMTNESTLMSGRMGAEELKQWEKDMSPEERAKLNAMRERRGMPVDPHGLNGKKECA